MELPVRPGLAGDRDDRGAVAVLVASCLLLLIGFAAIAVDSGIAYSDRRQQASAADVGALAAVQFAKTTLTATHPDCIGLTNKKDIAACRGAEEAVAVVEGTLPGRYPDADWNGCDDANKPVEYSIVSAISPCISFTSDLRRARVVMPGTDVETAFGRAIGFDTISVGAFAEAGLEMKISGGVLPFALGPSAASSNQACFFAQDTPTLDIEPCDKNDQGNFGKLDVRWYGNELYGTPSPYCTGQNSWRMTMNIITGTDHPMEPHWKNPGVVNDVTNCDIITNPVDEVVTWTGNAASAIADGLFNGSTGPSYEGRLICKQGNEGYPAFTYDSNGKCVTINTHHPGPIDHTPLWDFLAWSGGACNSVTNRAEMAACLADYNTANPGVPLFTAGIAASPRFGGVPELHSDPLPGASGAYLITGFKPVYLETLYLKCNAKSCETVHSPGENSVASPPAACPDPMTSATTSCGWPLNKKLGVEAISAFILTLDMLPDELADNFPYQDGSLVYNLYR
jgi:hypothetical protein